MPAPGSVRVSWCPECDQHNVGGRLRVIHLDESTNQPCPGEPITVVYVQVLSVRDAVLQKAAAYAGKGDPANILLSTAMLQALTAIDEAFSL